MNNNQPFRDDVVAAAVASAEATIQLIEEMYPDARGPLEIRSKKLATGTGGQDLFWVEVWDLNKDERLNVIQVKI